MLLDIDDTNKGIFVFMELSNDRLPAKDNLIHHAINNLHYTFYVRVCEVEKKLQHSFLECPFFSSVVRRFGLVGC